MRLFFVYLSVALTTGKYSSFKFKWNLLESKQCSTFVTDMRIAMRLALPSCLDSPFSFFSGIRRRDWQTMGRWSPAKI